MLAPVMAGLSQSLCFSCTQGNRLPGKINLISHNGFYMHFSNLVNVKSVFATCSNQASTICLSKDSQTIICDSAAKLVFSFPLIYCR